MCNTKKGQFPFKIFSSILFFIFTALLLFTAGTYLLVSNSILYNYSILIKYFTSSGKTAFKGPDGWIFYRPDLSVVYKPWFHGNFNIRTICSLNDTLSRMGIELLVVPVPDKEAIIQSYTPFKVDIHNKQRHRLINDLNNQGVRVLDLTKTFLANNTIDQLYRKIDTHWDQIGIILGAKEITAELHSTRGSVGSLNYLLKDTIISEQGDLSLMLEDSSFYSRKCTIVINQDSTLFSDSPESDILIFGDSFINVNKKYGAGIGAFVSYFSKQSTSSYFCLRCNNQGPRFLLKYLKTRKVKPKAVVWIFSSRFLGGKIEGF